MRTTTQVIQDTVTELRQNGGRVVRIRRTTNGHFAVSGCGRTTEHDSAFTAIAVAYRRLDASAEQASNLAATSCDGLLFEVS